jgi:osmotically-inducible protein OsmY
MVDNLALAARVKANLVAIDPKIQVTADEGCVYIDHSGKTPGSDAETEIEKITRQVEGVTQVVFHAAAPREQRDHINPFHNIG